MQQEDESVITLLIDSTSIPLHFVNFSYCPVDNFWVDQGYTWQYGYVNISRVSGGKMIDPVPLQYSTMEKVEQKILLNSSLGRSLIHLDCTSDSCNNLTLYAVNVVPGVKNFTSGNGIASFTLEANEYEERYPNVNYLNFTFGDTPFKDLENWQYLQSRMLGGGNITLKNITITVSTS
ncbi:MAG: hypothetical protein WC502_11255 [Methanolinea sp.]